MKGIGERPAGAVRYMNVKTERENERQTAREREGVRQNAREKS